MNQVILPYYHAYCRSVVKPTDRPILETKGEKVEWCLVDTVHYWLADRNILYGLVVKKPNVAFLNEMEWIVEIEDPNDAMLFKLTWG